MMSSDADNMVCRVCNYQGCDLRLIGCGCTIHARCAPLSLILEPQDEKHEKKTAESHVPKSSRPFLCLFCKSSSVSGLYVLPLSFKSLDQAIELRKAEAISESSKSNSNPGQGAKRCREDDGDYHAEASYIVFSQGRKTLTSSLADADGQRTGRWTEEELALVDHFVTSFDQGQLPLPNGSKLSAFLGDMLLCKPSRLTKKMKNAKLSTRSFELSNPKANAAINKEDFEVLSALQKRFIATMPSQAVQLEVEFNITKQWRTYFSDLCVQVGYPYLDVGDWITSLEELESKTASSQGEMRNMRRRQMGFNLRNDVLSSTKRNELAPPQVLSHQSVSMHSFPSSAPNQFQTSRLENVHASRNEQTLHTQAGNETLDGHQGPPRIICEESLTNSRRPRSYSEDLDSTFMSLMDLDEGRKIHGPDTSSMSPALSLSRDPFLQAISMYMEEHDLPFHHADVWVPSFVQKDEPGENVRLLHAGHVTRKDQLTTSCSLLQNFGEYSKSFSFEPGQGLPGRVYATNKVHWAFELSELAPTVFARSGGAKAYGVKTAIAIPLCTAGVGRMVVVLYSCNHIVEDVSLAERCSAALAKYSPQPQWKLVIEIDEKSGSESHKAPPLTSSAASYTDSSKPCAAALNFLEYHGSNREIQVSTQSTGLSTGMLSDSKSLAGATSASAVSDECEDNHGQIISLLGDQLSSSVERGNMLPHFMSIRLLLLRPAQRRSPEENEMIEILKSSFKAYSETNDRSGTELATILAQEWICLKSIFLPNVFQPSGQLLPPSSSLYQSVDVHQSHEQQAALNPMDTSQSIGQPSSPPFSPEFSPEKHLSHQLRPVLRPADISIGKGMPAPPSSFLLAGPPASMLASPAVVLDHPGRPLNTWTASTQPMKHVVSQVFLTNSNQPLASSFADIAGNYI